MSLLREYIEAMLQERSFTEADVPKFFYVTGNWEMAKESIHTMRLDGIVGISATHYNMFDWLSERDRGFTLKMPGEAVLSMNRVSRIMYDNPDYLASKNFAAISRTGGAPADIGTLGFYIIPHAIEADVPLTKQDFATLIPKYREQKPTINNVRDVSKFVYDNLEHRRKFLSLPVLDKVIGAALYDLVKAFKVESEWVMKNKTLHIPHGSTLYIKQQYLDYWDTQNALQKVGDKLRVVPVNMSKFGPAKKKKLARRDDS